MKRPMIYWVILFVLGEVLGYYFTISQMVIVVAAMSGVFIAAAIYFKLIRKTFFCRFRIWNFKKHWVVWTGFFFVLFGMMNIMGVKEKIQEYIERYYSEYDPAYYSRIFAFMNSLMKTKAVKQGNTWVANVYIDTSIEYSSMWDGQHWNMGNTAYMANKGQHGWRGDNYSGYPHFFDEAFREIMNDEHLTSNLASFLKKNGINVTYERYEP